MKFSSLNLGRLRAVFFLVSNVFYYCAELNNAPRLMYRVFIRIYTITEHM